MPVSEKLVYQFLNRELMNFEWVKQLDVTQVDEALDGVVPKELTKSLWLHQKATLLILQHQDRFIPFIEMGGGKTMLMLTMIRQRKLRGEKPRAIVFVPYVTATQTWVDETLKHAPELKCCALIGSGKQNLKALNNKEIDLFVMCYQSAVAMVKESVIIKGKRQWCLNEVLVSKFDDFDMLIMDELHKTKSSNSLTFELCLHISDRCKYVYGLTGTPFGRDLTDLWAQFFLIDFGETLGTTISFYKHVFFTKKFGFFGGVEFKFKKRMLPKLREIIQNRSIRYAATEFSDMPTKIQHIRRFKLPKSYDSYVTQAKRDLKEAVQTRNFELAGNSYLQLTQLSSGFLTFKDDEDRLKIAFDENPKLDGLCELVEEMSPDCKMVVFHNYTYTNELISNRLKKLKIGHARIWGGQKDKLGELRRFRDDPNCTVMILNSQSGSSSLNLQFANYVVFFEQPTALNRSQGEARVWRSGQLKHVFIYDLFIMGTLDEDNYRDNKEGRDTLHELMDGKRSVV